MVSQLGRGVPASMAVENRPEVPVCFNTGVVVLSILNGHLDDLLASIVFNGVVTWQLTDIVSDHAFSAIDIVRFLILSQTLADLVVGEQIDALFVLLGRDPVK
ncbi:hypothetical protein OGAPHI_001134 [Ogataea philodendri]|uniref:Uncharacterized protein n=1 Tax=Ogataea philodendri TaxID=1378263 RepID=A0A9P8PG41_9ASCO|nr:uncharacterized protein OGAPHI_001134 [Ogataea philodendri]KAH3670619.1 hypothetical protein OGAPHI_001134 [Ogataea philodendri]